MGQKGTLLSESQKKTQLTLYFLATYQHGNLFWKLSNERCLNFLICNPTALLSLDFQEAGQTCTVETQIKNTHSLPEVFWRRTKHVPYFLNGLKNKVFLAAGQKRTLFSEWLKKTKFFQRRANIVPYFPNSQKKQCAALKPKY